MSRYLPNLKQGYPITVRFAGLIGIVIVSLGFLLVQRNVNTGVFKTISVTDYFKAEAVPPTTIEMPKEPPRPAVPIESEDPGIEPDITIPETDLTALPTLVKTPPVPKLPGRDFLAYDEPPKPLTPIQPKYPEIAQEAGIEGMVIVKVFIDKRGRVKETAILQGIPNTGLNEAAIDAIRNTRFKPAKQREEAVAVWISIPVKFRLK